MEVDCPPAHADIKKLLAIKNSIRTFQFKYKDKLELIKSSKQVSIDSLIDFTDNSSLSMCANKHYQPGYPLIDSHPPAPGLEEMRNGWVAEYSSEAMASKSVRNSSSNDASSANTSSSLIIKKEPESLLPQKRLLMPLEQYSTNRIEANNIAATAVKSSAISSTVARELEKKAPARSINISFGLSDSEEESEAED